MTNYYVSKSGNNGNSGLSGAPKLTIQAGINLLSKGDTLTVSAGTYNEQLTITKSGTASQPILIQPATGETVIIDGTSSALKGFDEQVKITGSHVHFGNEDEGFTVQDVGVSGSKATAISVRNGAEGVIIQNNYIEDVYGAAILVKECGYFTVRWNTIYKAVLYNEGGTHGSWPCALNITRSGRNPSRWGEVYGNIVELSWGECIGATKNSRYVEIYDNITMYGKIGIYVDAAQDIVIRDNICYWPSNWNQSEYWTNSSGDKKPGFGIGFRSEGPQVSERNANPIARLTAENNLVFGMRNGLFIANTSGRSNGPGLIMRNNTCIGSTERGISCSKENEEILVYNNIFYSDSGKHIYSTATGNVTIRNNARYGGAQAGKTGTGDITSNPLLQNPNASINKDSVTLANMETVAADFKIRSASSPLIDAGWGSRGSNTDFFGAGRDSSPDIGFHEWDGVEAPPTERIVWDVYASPLTGEAPLTVDVNASGTYLSNSDDLTFTIDWGEPDSVASSSSSGSHTYTTPDDFTITVIAESESGKTYTYRVSLRVYEEGGGTGESAGGTATDLGSNGYNGTHSNTTLADGGLGRSYNGTTSYTDIGAVTSGFDGTGGLMMIAAKTDTWTDSTQRYLLHLVGDGDNSVHIFKPTDNNYIKFQYESNGATLNYRPSQSDTDWTSYAVRVTGSYVDFFVGGTFNAQRWIAGGNDWDASGLTDALIGVDDGSSDFWSGDIAHCLIAWDSEPTDEQIGTIHSAMLANTLTTATLDSIFGAGNYAYYPLRDATGSVDTPDNSDRVTATLDDSGPQDYPAIAYETILTDDNDGMEFGQSYFASYVDMAVVTVTGENDEDPDTLAKSEIFDSAEGGAVFRIKPSSAGVDATTYAEQAILRLSGYNGSHVNEGYIYAFYDYTNGKIEAELDWGGTTVSAEIDDVVEDTWTTYAVTWSLSGNEVRYFAVDSSVATDSISASEWDVDVALLGIEEDDDQLIEGDFTNQGVFALQEVAIFSGAQPSQSDMEALMAALEAGTADDDDFSTAAGDGLYVRYKLYDDTPDVSDGSVEVEADIDIDPHAGQAPLSVTVDLSGTDWAGASVSEYEIDFGDGTVVTTSDDTYDHTYTEKGIYTVQVIATSDVDTQHVGTANRAVTIYTGNTYSGDPVPDEYTDLTAQLDATEDLADDIETTLNHIGYWSRDSFSDTLAAGAVDGTQADVGTRDVTDSGSNISIGSGLLSFAGGDSSHTGNVYTLSPVVTRTYGRALIMSLDTALGTNNRIGLSAGVTSLDRVYFFASYGALRAEYRINGTGFKGATCGDDAAGTYAIVLRNTGAVYIQNGKVLWVEDGSNYDDMTLAASCYSEAFDVGYMAAPRELFPLADIMPLDTTAVSESEYTATADGIFDLTLTAPSPLSGEPGLVFRKQDSDNYWYAYFSSSGAFKVVKVVGGTADGSSPYVDESSVIGAGETRTIRVIADGANLTFWTADGATWTQQGSTVTDSSLTSQTTLMPYSDTGWTLGKLEAWKRTIDGDASDFIDTYSS